MSDVAALTAAMALVPGLYSRNKMFALFEQSHQALGEVADALRAAFATE